MTLLRRSAPALNAAALTVCAALLLHAAPPPEEHGIRISNMDPAVRAGDNFYQFCNGDWIKRTEIPSDRAGIGVFTVLDTLSNQRTAALIEEVSKAGAGGPAGARKVADLYNSYMNEAAIEAKGVAPLRPFLASIAAIADKRALARVLGETLRNDVDALNNTNFHTPNLFGIWIAPGFNDSEHYSAYLLQGGLQLPDREFYLSDSEHMRSIQTAYKAHIAAMLTLAGISDASTRATRVFDLEHAIAQVHLSLADDEDIRKANNTWKRSEFASKAPGLDWDEYFRGADLESQAVFTVWQPTAFQGESALVASQPLDAWKDWLAFHVIDEYAGVLPAAFANARFDFFGKTLSGTPQQRPRWQRGVNFVNALLGDEVGKIYAQRYFPPEAKAQAQAMVSNIIAAFRKRIDGLDWMNPSTKAEAQAKLNTLYVGIGYPETWRDYSGYEVKADDLFGNLSRGDLYDYHREIARIGSQTNRKEWSMEPQTVNAVNLPLQNALNFPAAILQPPFFDPKAPAAANYGAIGSIIGHEISHTFDTEGSAFDSQGRVRDWWTPADFEKFKASTAALAAQYDSYKPFPDLAVNGRQTLAEDIADVAGLAAAFDGFHASLNGQPAPRQGKYSGDQQFFIAFGQNWGSKTRDAAMRQQVATDPHAPAQFRAETVRNIDAWYNAFDVQAGAALYLAPAARVRIW